MSDHPADEAFRVNEHGKGLSFEDRRAFRQGYEAAKAEPLPPTAFVFGRGQLSLGLIETRVDGQPLKGIMIRPLSEPVTPGKPIPEDHPDYRPAGTRPAGPGEVALLWADAEEIALFEQFLQQLKNFHTELNEQST